MKRFEKPSTDVFQEIKLDSLNSNTQEPSTIPALIT